MFKKRRLLFFGIVLTFLLLILSLCASAFEAEVKGKNAEERALNAAKQIAEVKNLAGKTLVVFTPTGSENNINPVLEKWEKFTGIPVKLLGAPIPEVTSKLTLEAVTKSGIYDVLIFSPSALADFVESRLIKDITEWAGKYDPEIKGESGVIEPAFYWGMYKGRVYAFNTDGDFMFLFLRKSLLNDEQNKKEFEEMSGYSLKEPETWKELDDQIRFFGREENRKKGFYGAWLYRSPWYSAWEWMIRFMSQGKLFWDDNMHPQINSPEGVKALEEIVASKPYLHPGVATGGWPEAYKAFPQGEVYATIAWPSLPKYANNPAHSQVVGDVAYVRIPGRRMENGEILRVANFQSGWVYAVSNYSKMPEIAYLFSQYMYSPTVSAKAIPQPGFFDPFRKSHLNREIGQYYALDEWPHYFDVVLATAKESIPELALRGQAEYQGTLDKAITSVYQGMDTPKSALDKVAAEWEKITERYGRQSQIEQWQFLKTTFGRDVRKFFNIPPPPE